MVRKKAQMPEILYSHPAGHVLYRRALHPRPMVDRGEGVYLYDTEGRRYLDASGGAIVVNVGHGVSEVTEALAEQAARVAFAHPTMFTSRPAEDYAEALAKVVTLPDPRFFFLSSGSEAVETAIKFARQVQVERGLGSRYLIIARHQSYHGTTLGALSVAGKPKMRRPFQPMLVEVPHIAPPYCYRCPFGLTHPRCALRCADALAQEIQRAGADNVAAFIAEPVSGATLGAAVPPPGYWPRVRAICDRHEVLLIADEVMTGFGRTGRWFALDHWDVVPDVAVMSKGTAGGYAPLSITAARGDLVDAIVDGSGNFVHGGTFSHHPVTTAAGLATLRYLQKHGLVAAAARKGQLLEQKLRESLEPLPNVGDVRGIGLMWGVEIVADRESKAPFPPDRHVAHQIANAAFDRGLIVYPGSGCVDGTAGDHLTLGPPFIITEDQIDEMVWLLREAVQAEVG
ncbi:MAG: aspartate aminotransferase family protein [Chloroflexota bacterium]